MAHSKAGRRHSRSLLVTAATRFALASWLAWPAAAHADSQAGAPQSTSDEKPAYGAKGTVELGGAISADWMTDLFVLDVGPQFGYFFADHWELSLIFDLIYESSRTTPEGSRATTLFQSGLVEPSYHPLIAESVALLGGLGVGYERENGHTLFELAPRIGVNLMIGGSAVLTPAITIPILIGDHAGTGSTEATAGVLGEIEVSVAW